MCTAPLSQYPLEVLADGEGGLFLAWLDYRSGVGSDTLQLCVADPVLLEPAVQEWTLMGGRGPDESAPPRKATLFRRSLALLLALLSSCSDSVPTQPSDPVIHSLTDFQPAWSPRGDLIVYTHLARTIADLGRGKRQLFLYDLAAGDTSYLVPGHDPQWSPGGDSLIYVESGQVRILALASRSISTITDVSPISSPDWATLTGRIAFDTSYPASTGAHAIWTINSDGTDLRDISVHGTGEWRHPRWSPSGDSLVHYRYVSGVSGTELFLMAADGSGGRRLTYDNTTDLSPSWHPSEATIAWTRIDPSGTYAIAITDLAAGTQRLIVPSGRDPAWGPRDSLVFAHPAAMNKTRIWVSDRNGLGRRQLTY